MLQWLHVLEKVENWTKSLKRKCPLHGKKSLCKMFLSSLPLPNLEVGRESKGHREVQTSAWNQQTETLFHFCVSFYTVGAAPLSIHGESTKYKQIIG